MLRCLLIFALASNQLLSSGDGTMYICTGSDGSFCLETDPQTCTCCKQGQHIESEHNADACSCRQVEFCKLPDETTRKKSRRTLPAIHQAPADNHLHNGEDGCGCVHLRVASGESTPVTRVTYNSSSNLSHCAGLHCLLPNKNSLASPILTRFIFGIEFALCRKPLDTRGVVMRC